MKKLRFYISVIGFLASSVFLVSCDDEASGPSKVGFPSAEFSAGESDGKITLGVQLDKPATEDITIEVSATGGTATEGDDFEMSEATVVIPKGETNGAFEVTILKDVAFEGDETIEVSISSADGLSDGDGKYTITIVDNDCDFDWIGTLGGYDVNLDKVGEKYDANVTIAQDGDTYTIDGLNVGFIQGWWGETILESVPVTFTVDSDGNIAIENQYIFTTEYEGDEYVYTIEGTGKLNTCDGNITLDYDVYTGGDGIGEICHGQNWMTDLIFKAVLEPEEL